MKVRTHKFCASLKNFIDYSNVGINGTHFVLKCPLSNSLSVRFPSLFHNLVLGNLKVLSQVNHQVGIVERHIFPIRTPSTIYRILES